MIVLSSSYGIIMDRAINAPVHINNVVDGINATDKRYLKEMELICKLASNNNTSEIGRLPGASKDVSIKFSYHYINILNNKETSNGLKGSTKFQKKRITIQISISYIQC